MARIEAITLYKFDELNERAKERARDWYRQGNMEDSSWAEFVIQDASEIAKILGIELRQRPVQLMGGGTRLDDCIYWSGFCCQGDGASYEGVYRYDMGAVAAIQDHAPQDKKLHSIASQLEALHQPNIHVDIRQGDHRYCHEYTMDIRAINEGDGDECEAEVSKAFEEPLRDFARWIYSQLEKEYYYRQSDETVDEDIRSNEYEFTEDGKIA